jgi:formylglycine-generating enzyme
MPTRRVSLACFPFAAVLTAVLVGGCRCSPGSTGAVDAGPDAALAGASQAPPLEITPVPAPPPPSTTGDLPGEPSAPAPPAPAALACRRGMMAVAGTFCIDKWEASLIDEHTQLPLSPYYPPDRRLAAQLADAWEKQRSEIGSEAARQVPLPALPQWQREREIEPVALSKPDVTPNGYLSGLMAERACHNAGKRLCRYDEWLTACEGEAKRRYPYGVEYRQGACNIFRPLHPAKELHDNAAVGHLDPRLDLVREPNGDPLLRHTGATPACKSEWGGEAAWDMNGNLDEWVDDEKGRFVGGFFSRSKRDGCESSVTAHPPAYLDYSTGTRCCWSPDEPPR